MMYENDKYEVPKWILKMSPEKLEQKLAKERAKMVAHPKRKPKVQLKRDIKFLF